MQKRGKYRRDLLVILMFLAAGLGFALVLFAGGKAGTQVQIRVDGELIRSFPLDSDMTCEIQGADGGRNLLVIRNGEAWIQEASCPDGLCMHMGKISRAGQSVICLPNKVVVEIAGNEDGEEPAPDIIVR